MRLKNAIVAGISNRQIGKTLTFEVFLSKFA
jgi:hypothetical protein